VIPDLLPVGHLFCVESCEAFLGRGLLFGNLLGEQRTSISLAFQSPL
jgi:hypothetical protein